MRVKGLRSYSVSEIDTVQEVFDAFPDEGTSFELNWLFVGTSGVHGSYATLDDAVAFFANPEDEEFIAQEGVFRLTVLLIRPRLVQSLYGDVSIEAKDIPRLRYLVTRTLAGVAASQAGSHG